MRLPCIVTATSGSVPLVDTIQIRHIQRGGIDDGLCTGFVRWVIAGNDLWLLANAKSDKETEEVTNEQRSQQ